MVPVRSSPLAAAALAWGLLAAPAGAAAPPAIDAPAQAELKRGLVAVGPSTSDEPALRAERAKGGPTAAFKTGAAFAAWSNAAATLDFDLKNPSGDGDDTETIAQDCYEEKAAFDHLEAADQALGATPPKVVAAAQLSPGALAAWQIREQAAPRGCRTK